MYDLVAVGTITMDMYFRGSGLPEDHGRLSLAVGGKYYMDAFYASIGGSAANISIHAAQYGLDSAPVATVGENTFKNIIVQSLVKKSVSTEFLHFEHEHLSVSTILLTPSGERTVIKYSDPKEHIYVPEHALERIRMAKMIFMGNLSDVAVNERMSFLKEVKTSENYVLVNFGAQDCEKGISHIMRLLEHVDILVLNKYEFASLIQKNPEKIDLTRNHFSSVHTGLKLVVVTDGANGSYAYTSREVYFQEAISVKQVVDTTGAGDAFSAGFFMHYTEHKNPQDALAHASQLASKEITTLGAN